LALRDNVRSRRWGAAPTARTQAFGGAFMTTTVVPPAGPRHPTRPAAR